MGFSGECVVFIYRKKVGALVSYPNSYPNCQIASGNPQKLQITAEIYVHPVCNLDTELSSQEKEPACRLHFLNTRKQIPSSNKTIFKIKK